MKYVKTISRKSYLLPIYIIWKGLQIHIDEFLAESKDGFISYSAEINCRRKTSKQLTEKILTNLNYVKEYFEEVMHLAEGIQKKTKEFREIKVHSLSNEELWTKIKVVFDLLFQSGKTITQAREHAFDYVKETLKKEYPEEFINGLLIRLTSPTQKSLAVIEEEELIKKAIELNKEYNSIKFNELVDIHHRDWSWIPTDWAIGMPWSKTDVKNRLIKFAKEDPEKRLLGVGEDFLKKEREKEELFSQYIKSKELRKLIEMMEIEAFYRLHRRYVLSELLHCSQHLFEELAFRMKLETDLMYNLLPHEIVDFLLKGKQPDRSLVEERLKYFVLYGKDDNVSIHYGVKAAEMAQVLYSDIDETLEILKGSVGCQGKATGIARIIHSRDDFHKISDGEILVTHETTPDFMPILHKIKAIVTDEGGISCHAAVISREMNIPCVIGTNVATKVLKDGDLVEVDATKGIVKKVKE